MKYKLHFIENYIVYRYFILLTGYVNIRMYLKFKLFVIDNDLNLAIV